MMKQVRKHDPPEYTALDHAHTLTRAGISALPYVSGPAVELFNFLVAPPLERRRQTGMQEMAVGLRKLEDNGPFEKRATTLGNEFLAFISDPT